MEKTTFTKAELFEKIKPGSRITFLIPAGIGRNGQEYKEATGKAVIITAGSHVAVNMGGRYGTPAVVTVSNLVAVGRTRASNVGIGN